MLIVFILLSMIHPMLTFSLSSTLKVGLRGGASRFSSSLSSSLSSRQQQQQIPVTLLSGFLGAGKTTTLQQVLQSPAHNLTIGVVVNDVASVNIDSKLVKSSDLGSGSKSENVVEMQNGCACCSLSGELLDTVETLLDSRGDDAPKFDHILVELSGVADPLAVRGVFEQGVRENHGVFTGDRISPLVEWMDPDERPSKDDVSVLSQSAPRIVTLVDSTTFGTDFMTGDRVADRPEFIRDEKPASQRDDNVLTEADLCLGQGVIAELLVEQVESADLIVVNKLDLLEKTGGKKEDIEAVVKGLNNKAKVVMTSFGEVDMKNVLGGERKALADDSKEGHDANAHDHAHDCDDPNCNDPAHNHSHDHDHAHDHSHDCDDPNCNDPTHKHSHDHSHDHDHAHDHSHDCNDPNCSDPSHNHDHNHDHEQQHEHAHDCGDPNCNHPDHDHSKSTAEKSPVSNSVGISSFTYKSARPFSVSRLLSVLNTWPVPVKDVLDIDEIARYGEDGIRVDDNEPGPGHVFANILRSKGFCWMCPSNWDEAQGDPWRHDTAMFWSHAGKHFGINSAGKWWGSVESKETMKKYLSEAPGEYERILKEDWASEEWGDRRQELVFIGVNYDQQKICETLDSCLLTDEELDEMRECVRMKKGQVLETNGRAQQ